MSEYLLFMHTDAAGDDETDSAEWDVYLDKLKASGSLRGGSEIAGGVCLNKSSPRRPLSESVSAYIRIEANDLEHARELVAGNPVFENGGTVEIIALSKS